MEAFITRKKRKLDADPGHHLLLNDNQLAPGSNEIASEADDEPTEVKLAILSSLHPSVDQETLLDILLAHDGSVLEASAAFKDGKPRKKGSGVVGSQSSLRFFPRSGLANPELSPKKPKLLSKKGKTLFLFDPIDISEHTPCTVLHNFLPAEEADSLLKELLEESKSFEKITFKLFDNVVESPHTSSFYVGSLDEVNRQKMEYLYSGARLTDVRELTPELSRVKPRVEQAVNREIQERIRTRYPGGKKLKYQPPGPWRPNAAFVNCYNGPQESVGWHSDRLTYLGPRAVIGSLSLGVAREFRVRRVLPRDGDDDPDAQGQISIHLPHNSLLVMHAEMQEEWKHSIAPAQAIDPHPIAGNKRINITYRDYRDELSPSRTPHCRCDLPAILRVVQRKKENFGRYFWMCCGGDSPGEAGCSFFQWAEFDDDGNPMWDGAKGKGT
ncbi:uncharacterized protein E0L32_008534 [Thyridium curvatum]|uniref:Uncharacterized protein n=1 Tax=Thyridium curvatum TaxID=1093900 RepID=A0A507AVG3_9PEZI|nr:uncharacterized protein E0L32_008534 [Thyridium curvatum]TPX10484.1 hypothetical protein E0L32_008534 [Thyridium curvatum]